MANTAILMHEAIELVREAADPTGKGTHAAEKALLKLDAAFKSFQKFEKRYNEDRLGQDDLDDLVRICRWAVMFDGVESRFDQIGRLAQNILHRHGLRAYVVGDTGAVVFEKIIETAQEAS